MLYMRIHGHRILVNVRFRVPYLFHATTHPNFHHNLTLTLHLLLNSQLVTRDELTY